MGGKFAIPNANYPFQQEHPERDCQFSY